MPSKACLLVTAAIFATAISACSPGPSPWDAGAGNDSDAGTPDAMGADAGSITRDAGLADGGVLQDAGPGRFITRVGAEALEVGPDGTVQLTALVVDPEGMPGADGGLVPRRIADAEVRWSIAQNADAGTLSAASSRTNADGLASVTLTVPGALELRPALKVVAQGGDEIAGNAPWTVTRGTSWTPRRYIQAVPKTPFVATPVQRNLAVVTSGLGRIVELRVRVTEELGETEVPIPDEPVRFQFEYSVAGASLLDGPIITTNGDGEAAVRLLVGTVAGRERVTATMHGPSAAIFDVTVKDTPQQECVMSSDCDNGWSCMLGQCTSPGCNTRGVGCPVGYQCDLWTTACVPIVLASCEFDLCPHDYTCDPSNWTCSASRPQCGTDLPCPTGGTCVGGVCFADHSTRLDVTGHWYLVEDFDVSAALPAWVQLSAESLAVLDDLLAGQLDGVPESLSLLVRGLLQMFLPSWAPRLVAVLHAMPEIFAHLRVRGELSLTPLGDPGLLYAEKRWTSIRLQTATLCPEGVTITDAENPPACAVINVPVDSYGGSSVVPETAVTGARVIGNQLMFDHHYLRFDRERAYLAALSKLTAFSGYKSTADAIRHLVDCELIGELALNSGLMGDAELSCQRVVNPIQTPLRATQDRALELNGQATIFSDSADLGHTVALGFPDSATRTVPDGTWGETSALSTPLPTGRWRASRDPIP